MLRMEKPRASALETFVGRIPRRPYASDDPKRFGVRIMDRKAALKKRYLQIGSTNAIGYLRFDLDYPGAADSYADAGLFPPTIAVVSPQNRHAHTLYEIAAPLYVARATAAVRYALSVQWAMRGRLNGDRGYSGLLVKNPLHPDWITRTCDAASYSLDDLADSFDPAELRRIRPPHDSDTIGRNCALFDTVRLWAYGHVGLCERFEQLLDDVELFAHDSNTFSPPLPYADVKATARSIARFCWRWRKQLVAGSSRKSRRAMGFAPIPASVNANERLEILRARQAESAHRTNVLRVDKTREKIVAAIAHLQGRGIPTTITTVARVAQVARETISRGYSDLVPRT